MTFASALKNIAFGEALKLPGWGGYVKKTSTGTYPEYSPSSSYSVNDIVEHSGRLYICLASGASGQFDESKWERTKGRYHVTFVERTAADPDGDGATEYKFLFTPTVDGQSVTDAVSVVGSPKLYLDDTVFPAMMSSDWVTGTVSDFEKIRSGSGRW